MTTKNILLGLVGIGALAWMTVEMIDSKSENMMNETSMYQELTIPSENEQVFHDWECSFIVEDRYTQEGGSMVHYVDEVIENVDGSITFIGEDGLVTKIPYPYYNIEKNPNKKS